jgi:Xaa-Pro aminopeptidase
VHVGPRTDPDVRYLTGYDRPGGVAAVVFVPPSDSTCDRTVDADGDASNWSPAGFTYCPPAGRAGETGPFVGRALTDHADAPPGTRAVAVLDAATAGSGTVLVPSQIPHAAAVRLERAGYEVTSTDAVSRVRARKRPAERACIRVQQEAAVAGAARAAEILASSSPSPDGLFWADDPLTATRLRREANAALVAAGATDVGDSRATSGDGRSSTESGGGESGPLRPGEPVVVDLAPRGPHGYRGSLSRTFVVGGDGGWERRAHVAVTAALRAGLSAVEPDVSVGTIQRETAAELAAFGFDADADRFVRGVGLTADERPSVRGDHDVPEGAVLAVEPSVTDSDRGTVRVGDLAAVTADGYELLATVPRTLVPE